MPAVKVGDINIYYEIHGKGEPLVIVPGWTANVDWFFRHIPIYSREYRVVAFDNRGSGRTDSPDIPYTMEMIVDDLAGLLDAIGIESAQIMGGSMGGMIAQEFTLRYPKRVRSLILACTGFGPTHGVLTTDPEVIESFQHPKVLPPRESVMASLQLMMSQKFIDGNPGLIAQMIDKFLEHPALPHGQMRQGQAIGGFEIYDRLPGIKAPTLVIHGSADRMMPVENGRILASRIPGAELVIFEKTGHGFMWEAFDESNRVTLDFLKRHRARKLDKPA